MIARSRWWNPVVVVGVLVVTGISMYGFGDGDKSTSSSVVERLIAPELERQLRDRLISSPSADVKCVMNKAGDHATCAARITTGDDQAADVEITANVDPDTDQVIWRITGPVLLAPESREECMEDPDLEFDACRWLSR